MARNNQPAIKVWMYTGYKFEDIKDNVFIKNIDVLVDGQFKKELYDAKLKWRGSSNQRVIAVKKSIIKREVINYI